MEATQAGKDGCLKMMKPPKSGRRKVVAKELRENLKHFVNSEIGSVSWQVDYEKNVGETRGDN